MHLYDSRLGEFVPSATSGQIADALARSFRYRLDQNVSDSEKKSWKKSLGAFAEVVADTGMDDAWIVLEYQLPLSSARLDAMLLGTSEGGDRNAVILEFKQWTGCDLHPAPGIVRIGNEEKLHPSAQALAYKRYLADAHAYFVDGEANLHSAAFLHNLRRADESAFMADGYRHILEDSPVFSADMVEDLGRFVGEKVRFGAHQPFVNDVLQGQFQPSKTLLANVAKAIDGHRPWQLLDEQLVVFHTILADVRQARSKNKKKAIVVRGGPGTGKSIIAAQLVGAGAKANYTVVHATGSKAFTTVMRSAVGSENSSLFKYTSDFTQGKRDLLDLIVVDEAHRLRERTTGFRGQVLDDTPQWERIEDAARVSVFLLDEKQKVKSGEAGSTSNISSYAKKNGIEFSEYDLDAQFRCAGSESYIHWIEHCLALRADNSMAWRTADEYEVVIHDSINSMEQAIRGKAGKGRTARIIAGFCWPWSDPRPDKSLINDVTIGSWSMPWNRKAKGTPPPARHPYTIWARQPEGINEIGCIYSAQGFEFDYIGVIWGKDLRWDERLGRWIADLRESRDTGWKKGLAARPDDAVEQLQHIYRVLATRGMKGAHFYFLDDSTKRRFQEVLQVASADQ